MKALRREGTQGFFTAEAQRAQRGIFNCVFAPLSMGLFERLNLYLCENSFTHVPCLPTGMSAVKISLDHLFLNNMLIQPYSPTWIQDFENLKAALEEGLQGINCRIEHVGSTAVPGLAAKAIIDIDIIYSGQEAFEKIKTGLIQIGYYHNGNQGIEDRDVFKRNANGSNEILDTIVHHLYVCRLNSPALKRHLLFRDHLRRNEEARLIYQQMKYDLAEKAGQDKKRYAALKEIYINPLVDTIIEKEKQA